MKNLPKLFLSILVCLVFANPSAYAENCSANIYDLKHNNDSFTALFEGCATEALGFATGTAECLTKKLGLSKKCSMCFGELVECTYYNCMKTWSSPCGLTGANKKSAPCQECIADECGKKFKDCSELGSLPPAPSP